MTVAALVLALALTVLPAPGRRARALMVGAPRRRRLPVLPGVAVGCGAAVGVFPWTVVAAVGLVGVAVVVRRRRGRRRRGRRDEAAALQGALDVLVGELRIGAHPVTAMGVAAGESGGRIARSLGAVAARAVLGADVAAGLRAEGARSTAPAHWDRLAACWELAQTHGLAIATLLQAAQRDIVERERFHGRVEAGLAGARATAAILAGLPVLGVLLGQSIGADPLRFLMSGGVGGLLLIVGAALICCGLLWSDRITNGVLT